MVWQFHDNFNSHEGFLHRKKLMTRVSTIDTLKFNGLRRTRLGPSCCQIKPKTRLSLQSAVNVGWVWPLINALASGLMVIPTDLRLKGFKVRWFTVRLRPTVAAERDFICDADVSPFQNILLLPSTFLTVTVTEWEILYQYTSYNAYTV